MKNSPAPNVSVCIPVYNGERYLAEAIDSVLSQTYDDFEVIVCDNCSTDDTEAIARKYNDPRVRYVRNEANLGLVGNANRCLELATGRYICVLHHDDVMLPENLELKVRLLDQHPNVGFVHSNILLIDRHGQVVWSDIWAEDSRRDYIDNGLVVFRRHLSHLPLGASVFIGAVLTRRECFERVGLFCDLPHCADSEMWLRLALFYDVACIGAPLVKYRVHPESTSTSFGDYRSLPYLKEHFLAASLVLDRCEGRLPNAKQLRRRTARAFGRQALTWADEAVSPGDIAAGRSFLKAALQMDPSIVRSPVFWKIALMCAAGPGGLAWYRSVKRRFVARSL